MTRFDPSAVPSSVDDQLSAINNEIGALNALEPAVVVEPEEPGTLKTMLNVGHKGPGTPNIWNQGFRQFS